MSHWLLGCAGGALAVLVAGGRARADTALLSAGAAEGTDGAALAGELELRFGRATATARIDHGETVLAGIDFAIARSRVATSWDDACLAHAAPGSCWVDAAHHADQRVVERAIGVAAGVRRDGSRYDAVGALRFHPTRDPLGDVLELAATAPVAGRDEMYVNHARFAPGWFARAQWRISIIRIGGEVGMTGLEARDAAGEPRPATYALATLAFAVEL